MKSLGFGRNALCISVAAALLQGCSGSHSPFNPAIAIQRAGHLGQAHAATKSYRVLFSFANRKVDGTLPLGALTDVKGTLYGTTAHGSLGPGGGNGLVFSSGSSGEEHVLYRFKNGTDGRHPHAALALFDGALYGTTAAGGVNGYGTVFSLSMTGKEHVLYSFKGVPDGSDPKASLTVANGTLYGTTQSGGTSGDEY